MLSYISKIKGDPYKLGFIDEKSPKELESIINDKLIEYNQVVHVDSKIKINKILIILELKPPHDEASSLQYIKHEKEKFKNYYTRVVRNIVNSNFYDLYL